MRPAISDSLISGQPLYLLYSNSNCGAPLLSARFAAALATQATGSVRLHVTGRPPTSKGLAAAAEAGNAMAGNARGECTAQHLPAIDAMLRARRVRKHQGAVHDIKQNFSASETLALWVAFVLDTS